MWRRRIIILSDRPSIEKVSGCCVLRGARVYGEGGDMGRDGFQGGKGSGSRGRLLQVSRKGANDAVLHFVVAVKCFNIFLLLNFHATILYFSSSS